MAQTDFTISDVLEWARTKPASEAYNYGDNSNCAICQFLRDTGRATHPTVGSNNWTDWATGPYDGRAVATGQFDNSINLAAQGQTFGGFADRLAAILPAEPLSATWTKTDAYMADIELALS